MRQRSTCDGSANKLSLNGMMCCHQLLPEISHCLVVALFALSPSHIDIAGNVEANPFESQDHDVSKLSRHP